MSSTPATTEPPSVAVPAPPAALRLSWTASLRRSMAAQIALAITLVGVLLVTIGCWMAGRLLEQEFDAIGEQIQLLQARQGTGKPDATAIAALEGKRYEFKRRAWRIVFAAVGSGAAIAGLFAWWFTHRLLASARRLSATADRISARALHERMAPDEHPTELEPLARAFNHMLDRLEDAFARLSAFSSDLAHDLRAPIHRLMTATQVALSRPRSPEEYRELLAASVEDYERIGRLIDNILFLARADHAQAGLDPVWVPLAERIASIAEFFDLLAEEHGVGLAWQADTDAGTTVWADETLMARAIGNLLTNALRHALPGSTVSLHARSAHGGGCTIAVANEGSAIAPEHQARIFQRRYRLETPHAPAEPGSGLGLAIVKSVMDLHGGSASVRSNAGEPTVFTLRFPGPRRRPVDLRPAVR